jgi:hypothetical protein
MAGTPSGHDLAIYDQHCPNGEFSDTACRLRLDQGFTHVSREV